MRTQLSHTVRRWNFRFALLALIIFMLLMGFSFATAAQAQEADTGPSPREFSSADVAAAQQFSQTLGIADWLGPLAPVALSPFFGIACLSGMALFGKGWVSEGNAFLGEGSPLDNPTVFWVFLILTLVTSIPRLTKVSKPFAQAVDQAEAWAGIITVLALKIMIGAEAPEVEQVTWAPAGVGAVTMDTLLMIAAAINIFVINTVKFFFEVLVWVTPVPAIDAMFEFANKAVCAALMAVYGYSPMIATGINLGMFVAAAIVFSWAYRRQIFFRTMLIDAVWQFFAAPTSVTTSELTVFPTAAVGDISARTKCTLRRTDDGWQLIQPRFLRDNRTLQIPDLGCSMELDAGYLTNSLKISGLHTCELSFSRRYNAALHELASRLGATLNEDDAAVMRDRSGLQAEMA